MEQQVQRWTNQQGFRLTSCRPCLSTPYWPNPLFTATGTRSIYGRFTAIDAKGRKLVGYARYESASVFPCSKVDVRWEPGIYEDLELELMKDLVIEEMRRKGEYK
jgi:hypothetical protein